MPGRRWSNGLHQAIEAKEGLRIARENQTLASITFQNLFRMYGKLSGMTGTADTEAAEFKQIYGLEVVSIPPNMPMVREDSSDKVYRTRREKYQSAIDDLIEAHKSGQPILVGTISIEQSEAFSRALKEREVEHNVLNAKQHEREAEIIAQAGRFNSVTISTNMAGRGTDILLGGNPDFMAAGEAGTRDPQDPKFIAAKEKFVAQCRVEKEKVVAAGGLFIIGTERHESRRIDNQLRGRAGRQGDPGKSRFYVSLEDDLMLRFGGERMQAWMSKLGWEEGLAIDGSLISRSIESAQKRVEAFHFDSRKHVTEYDDVMNKQRQVIYTLRHRVLFNEDIRGEIKAMLEDLIEEAIFSVCDEQTRPELWELEKLKERYQFMTNSTLGMAELPRERQELFDIISGAAQKLYETRADSLATRLKELDEACRKQKILISLGNNREPGEPLTFQNVEQDTLLETLDHFWNIHLQEMDHLREGIGWRGMGQKNPLYEYQKEGFTMFQGLMTTIRENVLRRLFFYEVPDPRELIAHLEAERRRREEIEQKMETVHQVPGAEGAEDAPANGTAAAAKSPQDARARAEAQRKGRRSAEK